MKSENERLVDEMLIEIMRVTLQYLTNAISAEQFLSILRIIFKASNL